MSAETNPLMLNTLRAGLPARFNDAPGKLISLAEVIPEEKYDWRPMDGVRSVSEVLMHAAQGNYYTTMDAHVKPPRRYKPDAER